AAEERDRQDRQEAAAEPMTAPFRHLDWEGVFNARDLGGLPTVDGGTTRSGALVRSDSPIRLTEAGWRSLHAYGIETIVDLRDPDVETLPYLDRSAGIDVRCVPVFSLRDRP